MHKKLPTQNFKHYKNWKSYLFKAYNVPSRIQKKVKIAPPSCSAICIEYF